MYKLNFANTAQKMKFSIKDSFCKCNQIRSLLRIQSHLLKKSLMENFIFCAAQERIFVQDFSNFIGQVLSPSRSLPLNG